MIKKLKKSNQYFWHFYSIFGFFKNRSTSNLKSLASNVKKFKLYTVFLFICDFVHFQLSIGNYFETILRVNFWIPKSLQWNILLVFLEKA